MRTTLNLMDHVITDVVSRDGLTLAHLVPADADVATLIAALAKDPIVLFTQFLGGHELKKMFFSIRVYPDENSRALILFSFLCMH